MDKGGEEIGVGLGKVAGNKVCLHTGDCVRLAAKPTGRRAGIGPEGRVVTHYPGCADWGVQLERSQGLG